MLARDWFEKIRDDVVELADMERRIMELDAKAGPKAVDLQEVGHGFDGRTSLPLLNLAQAEIDYEVRKVRVDAEVERALAVLYGADGDGGLAKAKDSTSADCICGYYLMGMSWREVADEMVKPDSKDARHWCMMRARRAFVYMDRMGRDWLAHC